MGNRPLELSSLIHHPLRSRHRDRREFNLFDLPRDGGKSKLSVRQKRTKHIRRIGEKHDNPVTQYSYS